MGESNNAAPQTGAPPLERMLGGLGLVVVIGLASLLAWHSLTDLDIWFHLRAGQDLLNGGGFPQVNTYSFTDPAHVWLNHEWLYQVVVAWTGPDSPLQTDTAPGWHTLRTALIIGLITLLVLGDRTLSRLRKGSSTVTVLLTCLAAIVGLGLLWPRFNLRPELISYIFFVLLVRTAEQYHEKPTTDHLWRDRSLWTLFAIILVWAQCHGFAAMGPVILLLAIILRPVDRLFVRKSTDLPTLRLSALWAPVFLGVLALLLTPNHWRGLLFPLRALSQLSADTADLSNTVSELVPLLETRNSLGATMAVFKLSLVWSVLFGVLTWGRVSLLRLVLVAITAWAALSNQRNIGLYGLTFVMLHTGAGDNWLAPWWHRTLKTATVSPVATRVAAVILAVVVVFSGGWWAQRVATNEFYLSEGVGRRFGRGSTPGTYPKAAALALSPPHSGQTFANLDAAAFLLGTTGARLYVDGRTEAYPKSRWAQYNRLRAGGPVALSRLAQDNVSAVVLSLRSGAFSSLAADLLASPAWQPVAAGAGGILYLPRSPEAPPGSIKLLEASANEILAKQTSDATRRADLCLAAADLFAAAANQPAAQRALATGLQASPDHPQLNHNLGNQMLAAGNFASALPHFQRAFAVNGRLAGSALNAGVCQLRLGQTEASIASFHRSLGIDPSQVGGWVNLAVALHGTGQRVEAVAALEKAVALQPGDARLQGQLQQWRRAVR